LKIPDIPRVERSLNIARGFIQHYQINKLPVDPLSIINQNGNWEIRTVREVLTYDETYVMKSDDAEIIYLSGKNNIDKYLIVYNDEIKTPERIMWTIMHEIAHIVLCHLKDFEKTRISRNNLSRHEIKVLEREADIFTAEVMAPISILKALKVNNYLDIIRYCHISNEAA